MASGEREISKLGDVEFRGDVGKEVTRYARTLQRLGRDMAAQFDADAEAATAAMKQLGKRHKLLFGVDARLRAFRVARGLRRARDCALALSTEAVKFQIEYRRQFLNIDDRGGKHRSKKRTSGEVDF